MDLSRAGALPSVDHSPQIPSRVRCRCLSRVLHPRPRLPLPLPQPLRRQCRIRTRHRLGLMLDITHTLASCQTTRPCRASSTTPRPRALATRPKTTPRRLRVTTAARSLTDQHLARRTRSTARRGSMTTGTMPPGRHHPRRTMRRNPVATHRRTTTTSHRRETTPDSSHLSTSVHHLHLLTVAALGVATTRTPRSPPRLCRCAMTSSRTRPSAIPCRHILHPGHPMGLTTQRPRSP